MEGIAVSYSSVSRWYILAFGSVKSDVCWYNCLIFLDLGSISRHIACVSLGFRRKNIAFSWSGSVVFYDSIGNVCRFSIVIVNGGLWL